MPPECSSWGEFSGISQQAQRQTHDYRLHRLHYKDGQEYPSFPLHPPAVYSPRHNIHDPVCAFTKPFSVPHSEKKNP